MLFSLSSQLLASGLLGFNGVEILFHIINLLVLFFGLKFLLYKPVKKFMDKRQKAYADAKAKKDELEKEAELKQKECEGLIENAKAEAMRIENDAKAQAEALADSIVDEAKQKGEQLLKENEKRLEDEKLRYQEEVSQSVAALSLKIASDILKREVKKEDNDAVIDSVVSAWKGKNDDVVDSVVEHWEDV